MTRESFTPARTEDLSPDAETVSSCDLCTRNDSETAKKGAANKKSTSRKPSLKNFLSKPLSHIFSVYTNSKSNSSPKRGIHNKKRKFKEIISGKLEKFPVNPVFRNAPGFTQIFHKQIPPPLEFFHKICYTESKLTISRGHYGLLLRRTVSHFR